jgi:hypothetical protein
MGDAETFIRNLRDDNRLERLKADLASQERKSPLRKLTK